MTMARISADVRAEILRLRHERLTFDQIAAVVRVHPNTVGMVCRDHYGNQVRLARAALAREVAAARAEMATSPPFHPEAWG